MGYVWQNIPPARLTDILRYIVLEEDRPENLDTLEPYFPFETVIGQKVRWNESLDTPFTSSVPFRSFSTPMPVGKRPGRSRREAGMMPLGISYEFTEYDMLLQEAEAANATDVNSFFEPDIFKDVQRGARGALNRIELLMGNLLVSAGFTVNENGVNETIVAGRAAGNTAPAGIAWSNVGTALPHVDEQAALTVLRTTQGLTWREVEILTNRVTFEHYKTITSVRESLNSFRVLSAVGDGDISELRGRQDLPPIRVNDREILDPNGVLQQVIPNNAWIIVPRQGLETVGKTSWGTPQSANLQGINLEGDARRGPVAYVLEEANPPAKLTVVDAIGAPVMQAPNWTFHIQTNSGL